MSNPPQTGAVQTSQAPAWQQPYQQYGVNQALAQYQNVTSPQQLVAGFSPQQNQAISNIGQIANSSGGPLGAASNYMQNTLNGNPANNPYLSQQFNLAANDVQNRLSSEFAQSGRGVVGSLPIQSDELNNLATQLYGGAYNTGIQQQENALGNAWGLNSAQMGNQQALYGAGQQIQNLGQQYIQAPQTFLNNYLNQANQGLGTSTSITGAGNPILAGLGGASLGSQIGSNFGSSGSGWGALAGGLLGALGGG